MPKFLRWAEDSRLFKIVLSSWTMRVKSKSELVIFWTLRELWKREQNRNSKQEIPWLHGQDVHRTYYFFTVGSVKNQFYSAIAQSISREKYWKLRINLICFTLLSSKKQTTKLTKTEPTVKRSPYIGYQLWWDAIMKVWKKEKIKMQYH